MQLPFPGMDPYLEHPVIWEGVHARLIIAFANQLQPQLDPRYVASVEERVFSEGPQRRIPDVWIQKTPALAAPAPLAQAETDTDTAVILEVANLEWLHAVPACTGLGGPMWGTFLTCPKKRHAKTCPPFTTPRPSLPNLPKVPIAA